VKQVTKEIGLNRLVDGFLFSVQAEGKAPRTHEYYSKLLRHFLDYAKDRGWTDALQIGIGLRSPRDKGARFARCTQNYVEVDFDAPLLTDNTPLGDLFEIYEHPDYDGDLSVKVYLTNTGNLTKAYEYLNIELYLEDSVEAPNYRLLSLFNGVATFRLENPVSDNHILSVTGGSYTLKSREPDDWEAGYTVTPELYCEVTQR
jgi:hypothetical protein